MKSLVRIYSVIFALCLFSFSAYAMLDTFVITRVYAAVEQETEQAESAQSASEAMTAAALSWPEGGESAAAQEQTATGTDSSYSDGNMSIRLSSYRVSNTTVYVADIQTGDAAALKTAFSQSGYGRNVTAATSETSEKVGAILAVNGDNYGSREKGYVIRNGVLYRDAAAQNQEDLVIWEDGSFSLVRESEISARELLEQGARQVFSFGPGLLENGEITVGTDEEVDRAKASNPRTAVGILEEGHYVLVVSDGRSEESEGLSLYELAAFMQSLGVQTAYNLDGGGSSTMVFQGSVVNTPSGRGNSERAVTDILYL